MGKGELPMGASNRTVEWDVRKRRSIPGPSRVSVTP